MKQQPPLNDSIAFALARMVDDAQKDRRDPSHSDIEFCIKKCELVDGDPNSQGQTVGKAKRVRSTLTWAIEHSYENGCGFVDQMVSLVRSCGGFRAGSPNHVGEEAIKSLREALGTEGFILTSDGELRPTALDTLSGAELTEALWAYVRRAQKGSEDAALLVGTVSGRVKTSHSWSSQNQPGLLSDRGSSLSIPVTSLLGELIYSTGIQRHSEMVGHLVRQELADELFIASPL